MSDRRNGTLRGCGRAVLVVLLLAACAGGCRRRAPGQCQDHVECEAGFDCVGGQCVRRAGFPGAAGEEKAQPAAVATPQTPSPTEPVPAVNPAPVDAADAAATPPPKKAAPSRPPKPEPVTPPPVPPAEQLPLYKQRIKNG